MTFDTASSTGVAVFKDADLVDVYDLTKKGKKYIVTACKRGYVPNNYGSYHAAIRAMVQETVYDGTVGLYCMEDGFVGPNRKGSLKVAELRGMVQTHMYYNTGLTDPTYKPQPDEWRKVVEEKLTLGGQPVKLSGSDTAHAKKIALALVAEHFGIEGVSDNAAEAILIGQAFILSGRLALAMTTEK